MLLTSVPSYVTFQKEEHSSYFHQFDTEEQCQNITMSHLACCHTLFTLRKMNKVTLTLSIKHILSYAYIMKAEAVIVNTFYWAF